MLLSGVKWEHNTIYHFFFFMADIRQIYMKLMFLKIAWSLFKFPKERFLAEDSSKYMYSVLLLMIEIEVKETGREFRKCALHA